jgi:hypothetical protein
VSGRGPWHNNSTVHRGGDTPLGRALIVALIKLAKAGETMPSNMALGAQLGCCAEAVSRQLLIQEREGALVIEKRGKTFGLQRRVTIVEADLSTAPIKDRALTPRQRERFTYASHPVPKSPPVPEELRVERTRCPMCELPPGHTLCAHGWDGQTTKVQRRDMAFLVMAAA